MKTPEQMAKEYVEQEQLEYDEAGGAYYDFIAGYQAAKDQLADADKVMNSQKKLDSWISVKERLPEEGFENIIVLVWRASWHDYDTVRWKSCGFDDVNPETITHWMPLPNAPKGEK